MITNGGNHWHVGVDNRGQRMPTGPLQFAMLGCSLFPLQGWWPNHLKPYSIRCIANTPSSSSEQPDQNPGTPAIKLPPQALAGNPTVVIGGGVPSKIVSWCSKTVSKSSGWFWRSKRQNANHLYPFVALIPYLFVKFVEPLALGVILNGWAIAQVKTANRRLRKLSPLWVWNRNCSWQRPSSDLVGELLLLVLSLNSLTGSAKGFTDQNWGMQCMERTNFWRSNPKAEIAGSNLIPPTRQQNWICLEGFRKMALELRFSFYLSPNPTRETWICATFISFRNRVWSLQMQLQHIIMDIYTCVELTKTETYHHISPYKTYQTISNTCHMHTCFKRSFAGNYQLLLSLICLAANLQYPSTVSLLQMHDNSSSSNF